MRAKMFNSGQTEGPGPYTSNDLHTTEPLAFREGAKPPATHNECTRPERWARTRRAGWKLKGPPALRPQNPKINSSKSAGLDTWGHADQLQ